MRHAGKERGQAHGHPNRLSPTPRLTHRGAGFTLVELMLAVSLFGAILASVGGLVMATARIQGAWNGPTVPEQQISRAFRQLAQDLRAARTHPQVPVVVESERLELARVTGPADGLEWAKVVYRVDTGTSGRHLVRETLRLHSDGGEEPVGEEMLLAIDALQFQAAVQQGAAGPLLWLAAWDGAADGIPRLVQVTCTLSAQPGHPSWSLTRAFRQPAGRLPVVTNE